MSQGMLATAAGISQQAVALLEAGRTRKGRNLADLARVLRVREGWLETGEEPRDAPGPDVVAAPEGQASASGSPPLATVRAIDLPGRQDMPRDVPVFGVAAGNYDDGSFALESGDAIDYVRRGPGIAAARDVYGLYVTGTSMEPRYEDGDLIYVSAKRPVRVGDYVIVEAKAAHEGDAPRCYVKRLVRRLPDGGVDVEQFNPPKTMTFAGLELLRLHRVLSMADVLGV